MKAKQKRVTKKQILAWLKAAGTEGCAACHEPPEPQAKLGDIRDGERSGDTVTWTKREIPELA